MTFTTKFNISAFRKFTVLIAPLDWGLGHASRCIPIINHLKSIGCDVIIAACGAQQNLLEQEFPELLFVKLQGYGITFSKNRVKTLIKIFGQIPKILISINHENRWLKRFLAQNKVDLVISDNRYGLFNSAVFSIFVTHQLTIKTPFGRRFENLLRRVNYLYISNFTGCWIPDFEGDNNMGGELSHPPERPALPLQFIGRLSRITNREVTGKKIDLLIILSGPEPQRSIFEQLLLTQLEHYPGSATLIRGLPGEHKTLLSVHQNLSIYNHLPAVELNELINNTTFVISRSGYSTVMDVITSNKKCIFIPTPGQSEQEYLARYLTSRNYCVRFTQQNFQLQEALKIASSTTFKLFESSEDFLYQKVITDFIMKLPVKI